MESLKSLIKKERRKKHRNEMKNRIACHIFSRYAYQIS